MDITARTERLDVKAIIDASRGTTMSTEEICHMVGRIHGTGMTYAQVAELLHDNSMSIWRAVNDGLDPAGVRKYLKIKIGNRTRISFDGDEVLRDAINYLSLDTGLNRTELLADMVEVYIDHLMRENEMSKSKDGYYDDAD